MARRAAEAWPGAQSSRLLSCSHLARPGYQRGSDRVEVGATKTISGYKDMPG